MLFVIDMQNDYLDREKGKKYVKDSEKIVEGIINKIKQCEEKGEYIYYTSDIPIKKSRNYLSNDSKEICNHNNKESIETQERKSNSEDRWGQEPMAF